jgi:hypothetical protein
MGNGEHGSDPGWAWRPPRRKGQFLRSGHLVIC